MPKISVIVPVYNVEKYLNRCVDSILNQTFTDFECILVDDGSPDNCGKICDEYAKKDKRVKVIHKQNGGLSDARNAGIDAAQGEYLSFIDSDDWIHSQMLEILYNGIIKNDVLLSLCNYEEVEIEKTFEKIENPVFEVFSGMDFLNEKKTTAVVACNKLYHKSLFENIKYPVGRIHEDEFVTYKLLYYAKHIAFCSEKLYMYFVNTASITKGEYTPKHLDVLDAYEERIEFFTKNQDEVCLKRTLHNYMWLIYIQYGIIPKDDRYNCLFNELTTRMRESLKLYAKDIGINVINKPHYYAIAYPKFSLVFRALNRIRMVLKIFGRVIQ